MPCPKSRSSRKPAAAPLSAGFSASRPNENYKRVPSLCFLPEIVEMNYRPGVGTLAPATAGTTGNCRLQKATHWRQPPPLDVGKRTQSDLLNRINKVSPRPCQAQKTAFVLRPPFPRLRPRSLLEFPGALL